MIQNETSIISTEDRLFEHNIMAKLVGCENIINTIGYPWISPSESRRLYLDVISPDLFYDRNISCMISHMGKEIGCLSRKTSGVGGFSDEINPVKDYSNLICPMGCLSVNSDPLCGTQVNWT